MSKRWLSGVLIFALCCGSASLVTNAIAQEPSDDRGELEEGLFYVNTEHDVTLINKGKHVYVVMVTRDPRAPQTEPPVLYRAATIAIPRIGLISLSVHRVVPVSAMLEAERVDAIWRPCMGADCSFIGPLPPPPPPPISPDPSAVFLAPQQ